MKINIKSLLTGTTLVAASTIGIMADPPKGLKLIPNKTVTHPVFGEMKVISHEEDIQYYNKHCRLGEISDFMDYVLDVDSWADENVTEEDVERILKNCVRNTCAGRAMLKVITANYMREYERLKKFCSDHKTELKTFYEFWCTKQGKIWCSEAKEVFLLGEKLRKRYEETVGERLSCTFLPKSKTKIPECDLVEFYRYFSRNSGVTDTNLHPGGEVIKQDTYQYRELKKFYDKNVSDLEAYYNARKKLETKASDNTESMIGLLLEKAYEEATRKENEKKFLCIRRKIIPPCDFPTLYKHFFEEGLAIGTINNVLFRTVKLTDDDHGCLEPITLQIDLFDPKEVQKNYYVNEEGTFVDTNPGDEAVVGRDDDFIDEKYNVLPHELMHFMNFVTCYHPSNRMFMHPNTGDLGLSREEFDCDEGELEDLEEVLSQQVYDTAYEMWNMYGILYLPADDDNPNFEVYYDPINEAVANAECKIFGSREERDDDRDDVIIENEKERFVRTGHVVFDKEDSDEHKLFASCIKELNEKKGIYKFYFDEKLRDLIDK